MIKKVFLYPFLLLLFSCFLSSAIVIKNSKKTSGESDKKPGRILKLVEVKRITDYEDDFVFKRPRRIKIAPDGSVFVAGRDQLLKFTQKGHYVKNFLKKGEGPGEVKYFSNFVLTKDSVIIGAFLPVKIITLSYGGVLKNEFTVHGLKPFTSLLEGWNDKLYFVSGNPDISKSKDGVNIRKNEMLYVEKDRTATNMKLPFDTKDLMIKKTSKNGIMINMDELTNLLTAFDNNGFLYVSHTERYLIYQVDLATGKINEKFNRAYEPVKYIEKIYTKKEDIVLYSLHKRKTFNDINRIFVYKGNLLIFTSTMNKDKATLVDVFNNKGKYIDNFYIKIPGVERPDDLERKPILFHNGFLWTVDVDEDDAPYVLKYKIDMM